MIDKKLYISTGEFAKMMNVTKHTLFHYDKIGLFCPEIKMENDYRYYSIYQTELFDMIVLLRDLGMPLAEIKAFMKKRDTDTLAGLLVEEEKAIDLKIKELKQKKRMIAEQKEKINTAKNIVLDRIELNEYPKRYYISKVIDQMEDNDIYREVAKLQKENAKYRRQFHFEITFIQYKEELMKGNFESYKEVALLAKEWPKGEKCQVLPAGSYVTAYHLGHWKTIGDTYKRMFQFIKEQELIVDTTFYEEYMVDCLLTEKIEEYVTRISVRCIEKGIVR